MTHTCSSENCVLKSKEFLEGEPLSDLEQAQFELTKALVEGAHIKTWTEELEEELGAVK